MVDPKVIVLAVAISYVVLYQLGLAIYRLFFSPLSKLPGPWLTRISAIPEANALKEQRRTKWVNELFAQNPGAVAVRTGPSAVSFNHPDAVKAIYGHGKSADEFPKSSWYDAFSTTGESLFSTRSKARHAAKRRMVAHGYSAQSLQLFEPYVDVTLSKFMRRMDAFARTGEPFDIYFWFELFTMDLMGELALGDNFGVLEAGKPARYSKLVELSQRFGNLSGVLPFGRYSKDVLKWVPLPYVQGLWKARVEYLEYARRALERRFESNRNGGEGQKEKKGKQRQDIMQRFIEAVDPETGRKMDFDELRAETSSLMVAGASTGSVTLNWIIYYLCKNPSLKARLIADLDALFPEENPSNKDQTQIQVEQADEEQAYHPLAFTKLNTIRLIEHLELEALRLHPPIGYAMPRDTPPQGALICNHYIPPNTSVGVPAATIGRHPSIYPSPDTFNPDRWAHPTPEMKTCFLGFGYGSRQCIGRNVANQFIVKMVGTLLARYEVEMEDPALVLGTKEFTILKPDRTYRVILRRRG